MVSPDEPCFKPATACPNLVRADAMSAVCWPRSWARAAAVASTSASSFVSSAASAAARVASPCASAERAAAISRPCAVLFPSCKREFKFDDSVSGWEHRGSNGLKLRCEGS